jgi:hypothetical protein
VALFFIFSMDEDHERITLLPVVVMKISAMAIASLKDNGESCHCLKGTDGVDLGR